MISKIIQLYSFILELIKNKKKLIKFILPALVLFLAVVFFLLRRKK